MAGMKTNSELFEAYLKCPTAIAGKRTGGGMGCCTAPRRKSEGSQVAAGGGLFGVRACRFGR